MALQTDGYNADTEGSNNSPLQLGESDEEMNDDMVSETAQIVLERVDLNGGPPFRARDYMSGDEFSDYSIDSIEDQDSDYDEKPKKPKKRRTHKNVKCDECSRRFFTKGVMQKHKAVHSGAFTCPKCDKKCVSAGSLRIHQRMHTGERPFECEECDKAFAFKLQLIAHTDRDHSDDVLAFACEECDRAFKKEMHLIRHQLTHKKRSHECLFCGKGFIGNAPLRAHIQRVHRAQPSTTPGDGGRRSGRTTRVDYRDDVINVEETADEPTRKKRPAKAFTVKEVPNRLRQRNGAPAAAKAGKGKKKRRPMYTGTGTQPSRESSRRTKAVDYADLSSDGEEGAESEDQDAPPKKSGRGRPKREAAVENGQDDDDESQEETKPAKPGRGRGRPKTKKAAESEDEGQDEEPEKTRQGRGRLKKTDKSEDEEDKEEEPKKTPRGRDRHKKASESEEEKEEEAEPKQTPQRQGRPSKRQTLSKKAEVSEDEAEEAETPKKTPRGRGRLSTKRRSIAERMHDENKDQPSSKTTSGRGRPRRTPTENGEGSSGEEDAPSTKKITPRGRGRATKTAAKEEDSDEENEAVAENSGSDPSDADIEASTKTPARRVRAAAATPKSAIRGSGRRSTATTVSFAENSGSGSDGEESGDDAGSSRASGRGRRARDDPESRVPPKKRLRGRQ